MRPNSNAGQQSAQRKFLEPSAIKTFSFPRASVAPLDLLSSGLIPNLKENWSFPPGNAEPQLRFDAPKAQKGIAELGLRAPRCCGLLNHP